MKAYLRIICLDAQLNKAKVQLSGGRLLVSKCGGAKHMRVEKETYSS